MNRSQVVYFVLGGFFITNAILAELIGGKLFTSEMPVWFSSFLGWLGMDFKQFTMSVGILPWPVVFIATDLVNEFYGRRAVRFFTLVTVALILYMLVILQFAVWVDAASFSPVSQEEFKNVFGTSQKIILASIVAFAISQLVDVLVFSRVRQKTGGAMLWARVTGSTIISQGIDTYVIQFLAFYLLGNLTLGQVLEVSFVSYVYKIGVAIAITPLCYLGHGLIKAFVGKEQAAELIKEAHPTGA